MEPTYLKKPVYTIHVEPMNISIVRNSDKESISGDYQTNPTLKKFCDTLSLKSCTRRCVPGCSKEPFLEVFTEISEIQKDYNGNTVICFPKNPFLYNFVVKECDLEFAKGQNVWYRDSDPKTMLIFNNNSLLETTVEYYEKWWKDSKPNFNKSRLLGTIVEHYKRGWIDKTRYEYYQLNLASRSLYDILNRLDSPKFNHFEICQYLQDFERLVKEKNDVFLASKPEEYIQKAKKLAQEYKKIIEKSIMLPNFEELDGLMHKSEVLKSSIVKNPLGFVPSYIVFKDYCYNGGRSGGYPDGR